MLIHKSNINLRIGNWFLIDLSRGIFNGVGEWGGGGDKCWKGMALKRDGMRNGLMI